MRVLLIVDPHIPVPPVAYGGIERIAALLCEGLRERGHKVRLIAKAGSSDYGDGLWKHRAPSRAYPSRVLRKIWFQIMSLLAAWEVDVIINFARPDYLEALLQTRIPLLHCFHNPVDQTELDWLCNRRKEKMRFIAVSRDQVNGLRPADLIDVIHNAVDIVALQPPTDQARHYLAFLGRVTSNKGADTAITVAERSGIKLKLAGNISDETGGREFFETRIRPRLGENVEYVGPVDDKAKKKFLGEALALLFPIRWSEPFGLVMAEALACGTPVLAARRAAAPEVVEHEKTGFLCDTEDEMVAAVGRLSEIDRSACRSAAEVRFSPRKLVDGYLESINRVVESAPARKA